MGKHDDARAVMACHYEAGRAMASWWGGVGPQAVNMPWNDTDPNLSQADAVASVQDALDRFLEEDASGPFSSGGTLIDWTWREWERMEVAMVTCYADSVAWARHRERTVESRLLGDGRADVELAEAILNRRIARARLVGRSAAFGPDWDPRWPPCRGVLDSGHMAQAYRQKRREVAGKPRSTMPEPHPAHSSAR